MVDAGCDVGVVGTWRGHPARAGFRAPGRAPQEPFPRTGGAAGGGWLFARFLRFPGRLARRFREYGGFEASRNRCYGNDMNSWADAKVPDVFRRRRDGNAVEARVGARNTNVTAGFLAEIVATKITPPGKNSVDKERLNFFSLLPLRLFRTTFFEKFSKRPNL